MIENKKIQVYILTGFLGAGKTTLLNHLLSKFRQQKNVVIENEFGKISIDASLIIEQFSEIFELNSGCICCSLDEDLYDILSQLAFSSDKPDNLFIETSGISDAGNVAAAFKRDDISEIFNLTKVICVTDAENIEDYIRETKETAKQLVVADLIVINKANLVSHSYLADLTSTLKSLNPFAEITVSDNGDISEELLKMKNNDRNTFPVINTNRNFEQTGMNRINHKINSVSYRTNSEFMKAELLHALNMTLLFYFNQVYRIKGYVKFTDSKERLLLQSTGKRVSLEKTENQLVRNFSSELVFIGVGLKSETINQILKATLAKQSFKEVANFSKE